MLKDVNLSPLFVEYEALVAQVDKTFQQVAGAHTDEVRCQRGCSDCCHALFDVSLAEALYLNAHFFKLEEMVRHAVLIEADKADRKAYLLKKNLFRFSKSGVAVEDTLRQAGGERIRCPLLGEDDSCLLYAVRPLTCRVYGIPLEIGGASRTCGLSGFDSGMAYPTLRLERIQEILHRLSQQIVVETQTPYQELASMYVPVSSALLTVYDDVFFGLQGETPEENGDA